ncbi:hypothetical protein DFA_11211 [Cavenderia fasciculata]|uniref:Uncharacterized protein n=1 Tax=Cavenderia fasciculata TaxID=261658 RepID=F4QFE3_CACFS|nr:uncharacterized protein DFA_11211 [Cavenderia fasciculata]EGG13450.1 hypothetical protein DFA_11211 [Cavenderia fasciculata]|eukprot:XP_004350154.1 hypothetical protein DFA_11211 [Cavenderia fasciculata]
MNNNNNNNNIKEVDDKDEKSCYVIKDKQDHKSSSTSSNVRVYY